ncbi:hypothetical protein MBLNU459_g2104t1 [Dothideomycetes sp. NU459]
MPSFYPRAMPGRLPPTPPEFVPSFGSQNCTQMQYQQDPYTAQHSMDRRQDNAWDLSRGYSHHATHGSAPQMYHQPGAYQGAHTLPPISSYYEPTSAPTLPPLRIQERMSKDDGFHLNAQQDNCSQAVASQQQSQQQAAPKEEKATGGVSAKLDYEMERMTDFVAETAQGMYALHLSPICLADIDICRSIQPTGPIQPSFRKWVSQVLSATRLPSATILLSIYYLTVRLRDCPPRASASENQIYRLLAVALILGSKFLDDNTFINRSWSDVSGIRVSELNQLEREWLDAINYDLHCDPADPAGLSTWLNAWKEYEATAVSRSRSARLSPLDTNVQRYAPHRNVPSPYQHQYAKAAYADFTPQSSRSSSTYGGTPYVSADPWNRSEPASSVEAFYNSQHRYPTLDELDRTNGLASMDQARRSNYGGCALPLPHAMASSSYVSPWGQSSWAGAHPHGCNCMGCARQYMSSYLTGPGYAAQTVVG